jgi:sporulation protein YlmC with PRC-barrel domain
VQSGAQQETSKIQTAIPQDAVTVTDWYKQDVFDPNNNKIGQVKDVLIDKSGKAETLIIGVGGFLGAGEKDVAVPFEEVKAAGDERNQRQPEKRPWVQVRQRYHDLGARQKTAEREVAAIAPAPSRAFVR